MMNASSYRRNEIGFVGKHLNSDSTVSITLSSETIGLDSESSGLAFTGDTHMDSVCSSKSSRRHVGINLSRAASYFFRKSPSSISRISLDSTSKPIGSSVGSAFNIDDMFYRDLNRCTPDMVEYLRRQRTETSPITCFESDEINDFNESNSKGFQVTVVDSVMHSRLDGYQHREQYLETGHPEGNFMMTNGRRGICNHDSAKQF